MNSRSCVDLFERYIWLYNTILSNQPVTYDRVSELWQDSALNKDKARLPHKTFENHKADIQKLFHIKIKYVASLGYIIERSSDDDRVNLANLLGNSVAISSQSSNPHMEGRMVSEPVNGCASYISVTSDAIKERYSLWISYCHNYDPKRKETIEVKPIGLKQFRQRWYLIAELQNKSVYSFPLDRILSLEMGRDTQPSTIKISDLFRDSFGIIRETDKPSVDVELKVEKEQARYFKSVPLHHSQQVVEDAEDFTIFRLHVSPTYDFIMELMSHGDRVEVLSPLSLRSDMLERAKAMVNSYSK